MSAEGNTTPSTSSVSLLAVCGQAGRFFGWLLHHLAQIALFFAVLGLLAVGALVWRLSQGPIELTWLARKLESVANGSGPKHILIQHASIAWEGWNAGLDRPLDIRLEGITGVDSQGRRVASLPKAEMSISAGWLLLGRVLPRAIEVDGARLRVARQSDGSLALDLGGIAEADSNPNARPEPGADLPSFLRELSNPPETDRGLGQSRWAQLRRVRIHDAAMVVEDRQLGLTWTMPSLDIDLRRRALGGIEGTGHVAVAAGGQRLDLDANAAPGPDGTTAITAKLTPFNPADLAAASAQMAPMAALNATVSLTAKAVLAKGLRPVSADIHAHLDAGHVSIGTGTAPFRVIDADVAIAGGAATARIGRLEMAARPDATPTNVTVDASVQPHGKSVEIGVVVSLDQVTLGDLPALWPAGTGGPGTRPWITKNMTAGTLKDAHFLIALTGSGDLSDLDVRSIAGGFDGRDVTVWWLRPVPPIEHVDGHLDFVDPDTINVTVTSGRQVGGSQGGLMLKGGQVRLTGIAKKDQFADISADLAGPLADLITTLKNPRIKLLDRRPVPMRDPAGQVAGKLAIDHLPLKDNVSLDDLAIHTTDHLTGVHLGGIAAGRDLDGGVLDLDASNDGLKVRGTAKIASIPSRLTATLDFRNGPPSQVLTKVTVDGTADDKALAANGLDPSAVMTGPIGISAELQQLRDGRGDITVRLDLTKAEVQQQRAGMDKAAGQPGSGSLHIRLDHDRLASIDNVRIVAPGLSIIGAADVADGRPNVFRVTRLQLGSTTDVAGEIRFPVSAGDGYVVRIEGPSLDLSRELAGGGKGSAESDASANKPGPPWTVDARLQRVVLGPGRAVTSVTAHVENDGRIVRRARLAGVAGRGGDFHANVEPVAGGRQVTARAADAGALLTEFGLAGVITGGQLSVSATYNDTRADHPLAGSLDLKSFHVRDAPAIGKVLQAMTLYGLVDALSGPGLSFNRLVGSFRYTGDTLDFADARAFSSSLGLTAKGRLDLARRAVDVEGTVIPAYFFNSLLGDIPVIGRVFSPERGGGLFAATYHVHGPLADPSVSVNPLAALTPGFLRGIFDIFDDDPKPGRR